MNRSSSFSFVSLLLGALMLPATVLHCRAAEQTVSADDEAAFKSTAMPNPGKWPAPSYAALPKPDITVAADGSGNFKTIQEAINSIPADNTQRMVIYIKDGFYSEILRMSAPYVTLRGQSRDGTRIVAPAASVINVGGKDCIFQNLTVSNTAGSKGVHAECFSGRVCDHCVIEDCNVYSDGDDTIALWQNDGHYYHARLNVTGSVDFVCPHAACYMTDSKLYEMNQGIEAMMWHDGQYDATQKFVIRNCQYDGAYGFNLGRHHHDGLFFFLDCTMSKMQNDKPPYRVVYPLDGSTPTAADIAKNQGLDASNKWGERAYYFNDKKEGGNYPWMTNNLDKAPGSPKPEEVTAKWAFNGAWDPERTSGPGVTEVAGIQNAGSGAFSIHFSEPVTVKGKPRLVLKSGGFANYTSGSGSDTLTFSTPTGAADVPASVDLNGGFILASEADATTVMANTTLPAAKAN